MKNQWKRCVHVTIVERGQGRREGDRGEEIEEIEKREKERGEITKVSALTP